MIERYANMDVVQIWSDQKKLEGWANVELAVLKARFERYDLSIEAYKAIRRAGKS